MHFWVHWGRLWTWWVRNIYIFNSIITRSLRARNKIDWQTVAQKDQAVFCSKLHLWSNFIVKCAAMAKIKFNIISSLPKQQWSFFIHLFTFSRYFLSFCITHTFSQSWKSSSHIPYSFNKGNIFEILSHARLCEQQICIMHFRAPIETVIHF